jgi:hypothetical protein
MKKLVALVGLLVGCGGSATVSCPVPEAGVTSSAEADVTDTATLPDVGSEPIEVTDSGSDNGHMPANPQDASPPGTACDAACYQLVANGCFVSYSKCLLTCHAFDPACVLSHSDAGDCGLDPCWLD